MATKKKTEPIKRFTKSRWANQPIKAHESTGEILTKPNQSMSIREILFRNTQGMTYDNFKTPYYEDQATFSSQSLNKIQEMEPTEKLQYLNEVNSQVTELQEKIKNHEAQKLAEAQKIIDSANNSETTE
jgi:hypothetical protein